MYNFTFGSAHAFAQYYISVKATDEMVARAVIAEIFGERWSFVYDDEEFKDQPALYGLRCLAVIELNAHGFWRASLPQDQEN